MKIAEIVCSFPPYKGGMGKVALDNAKTLLSGGKEVTVFTPLYDFGIKKISDRLSVKRLFPAVKYGNAAFLPQLFWHLGKFNVVHLHYPFFGSAEIVWFLKKIIKAKFKLVVTYHMDTLSGGWLGKFFKLHNKYLMLGILSCADKIIISSFDYADNSNIKNIKKKYPEKFVELPFGVDLNRFLPSEKPLELVDKYKIKKGEKVILFVGGLDKAHYFKGVPDLIKAFHKLGQNFKMPCRLIIVGEGDRKFYYEQIAFDFGLRGKVIFAGRIDDRHLPRFYNLADLLVLPSTTKGEALGIVLLEAMASGVPVIASNLPGVRSVVKNGENGFLVEPKNIDDLVVKMGKILKNKELAIKLGKRGREIAKEKYNELKIGKKLIEIFDSL